MFFILFYLIKKKIKNKSTKLKTANKIIKINKKRKKRK
jgi:hypothetical protein